MLDNNIIQSTSSWPFVEVRKLLKDRKDIIKKKNKITFLVNIPIVLKVSEILVLIKLLITILVKQL